jgi:hypothetical protein
MSDTTQQLTDLRHEIDTLKAALRRANRDEQIQIRARINTCLRAYLQLMDARLQATMAAPGPRASDAPTT